MKHVLTLDEWVERNASDLSENIATLLDMWEVQDRDTLLRMIMVIIRNWHELGKVEHKEEWKVAAEYAESLRCQLAKKDAECGKLREALEQIVEHYIAESRQNDWVECCKLKDIARRALQGDGG